MFIGTVEFVEPQFFDPWDLSLRQRISGHFSEEDLERMAEDKTPAGLAKLKEAYVQMLPEPYGGQLARASTRDQLETLFNSLIESGRRAHFKVKEVFRGPKGDSIEVWSDFSDCGFHFQTGETYLVYADRDNDKARFETSACSLTKRLSDAGDDLAYLFFFQSGGAESARLNGIVTSQ